MSGEVEYRIDAEKLDEGDVEKLRSFLLSALGEGASMGREGKVLILKLEGIALTKKRLRGLVRTFLYKAGLWGELRAISGGPLKLRIAPRKRR